jgi:hypothetical protein
MLPFPSGPRHERQSTGPAPKAPWTVKQAAQVAIKSFVGIGMVDSAKERKLFSDNPEAQDAAVSRGIQKRVAIFYQTVSGSTALCGPRLAKLLTSRPMIR